MKSGSRLEKVLDSGQFAVTAEAGPPKGSLADGMREKGELLKSSCDAINVTDNQAAVVRMARDKGASDGGAVAVLATLREWKNNF